MEIAAVCDLSPAAAECAAERHRAQAWFTDHAKMLREARPDVVHVTTPPTSHFKLTVDALEAGAHVIVEKPITATLAEVNALARRASEVGRTLVEDYNYLFNRGPREIVRRIESGEFGAVLHVEVMICLNILGPGGFADPNAPHPVLNDGGGRHRRLLAALGIARAPLRWRPSTGVRGVVEAQAVDPAVR